MAGVHLPNDVILNHILTRVPAKSANRFKCVSKQWNSFLTSDIFKEMHNANRKKDDDQQDHKLFFISEHTRFFRSENTSPRKFFTINCEAPPNKDPCSRPLPPFEVDAFQICVRTSGHGLLCLWVHPDIILWNPLTTEYKKLPHMDNMDWYNLSDGGLYYSSCEDDYKLVLVARYTGTVYIYSLKSDSWRMVNSAAIKIDGCWKLYVFLNDSLYFLSENERKQPYSMVRFDTIAESFQKIETPSVNDDNKPHSATITVHRGYVHYCVKYDIGRTGFLKSTCIELWKLNADGDIWKKVVTYDLMPNDIRFLSPLHWMRNGNWLMINHKDGRNIFEVDLKKKKYTKEKDNHCHRSKGKNKSKSKCYDECKLYDSGVSMGWPLHIRYSETFVSPNQYMK